ncbi:MAG TPA: hypothetical protein VII63_07485 [Caulobacteraceae bacterium]
MSLSKLALSGLVAAGALSMASAAVAAHRDSDPGPHPCFFVTQWQGWSAPSDDVILMKVNNRDIYRVELSAGSAMLRSPGVHLVSKVRGSDSICSAIDLDLEVSDGHGFVEPLITRSLTRLTPEEAAAIPRKYQP